MKVKVKGGICGDWICKGELTEELDASAGFAKENTYFSHYILVDRTSFIDKCFAIRVPGGTVGHLKIDSNNNISEIKIDLDYVVKSYPENLNDTLQKYIGQPLELPWNLENNIQKEISRIEEDHAFKEEVFFDLWRGLWVDTDKVQEALGMDFSKCFPLFDFSRTAEWWSIVGKTEEERSYNGQKIVTKFRLKPTNTEDTCTWRIFIKDTKKIFGSLNHTPEFDLFATSSLICNQVCPYCNKPIQVSED